MFIDRNPFSETLLAKSHGRVDMLLCGAKTVLCLLFTLRAAINTTILIVAVCLVAALQFYTLLYYLPYYSGMFNQWSCSFALLFVWAACCTLMAFVRNAPIDEVPHPSPPRVFLCSL